MENLQRLILIGRVERARVPFKPDGWCDAEASSDTTPEDAVLLVKWVGTILYCSVQRVKECGKGGGNRQVFSWLMAWSQPGRSEGSS